MLPFTESEKKNVYSIYTPSDLNICRRKPFKVDLIDSRISNRKFTPTILFCLHHSLFTLQGVNNAQLLRDGEPITFLETARSLNEYILIILSHWYIFAKLKTAVLGNQIYSSNSRILQCKCQAMICCIIWEPPLPVS